MQKLVSLVLLSFLGFSCVKKESSELHDASCDQEIQKSGLQSRLQFCNLTAPSIGATSACINGALEKLKAVPPSCKVDAGRRAFANSFKLISFHAERLAFDAQGNKKGSLATNEIADLVRVTDLLFTSVKEAGDRDFYREALLALRPVQEKILQSLSLVKLNSTLVNNKGDILNRTAEELLSVNSETLAALNSAKNIETLLPFAIPALSSTVDHLELSLSLSQLYCDLDRCDGNWSKSRELVKILASLNNPEEFELTVAKLPTPRPRPVDGVFSLFQNRSVDLRSMFEAAAQSVPESKAPLTHLKIDGNFPLLAESLRVLERLDRLNARIENQSLATATLNFGLDDQAKALVDAKLTRLKGELSRVRQDFDNQVSVNFQNSLNEIQNNGQTANLKAMIDAKSIQRDQITEQALATQENLDILETDRARYILNFRDLATTSLGQDQTFFKAESESLFTVSPLQAADARTWPLNIGDKISVMAINPEGTLLKAGQSMALQVTGEWAPTCALKKSAFASDLKSTTPKIGSAGYQISVVRDKAQIEARSVSFSNSKSSSRTQSIGQSVGVSLPIPVLNIGMGWSDTSSQSTSSQSGFTSTQTEQTSVNEAASFNGGLRLSATPFPSLPAGALLVYRVPANVKSSPELISTFEDSFAKADQVSVVNAAMTLTANDDSRFYFIVNDCLDPSASAEALTVRSSTFSLLSTAKQVKLTLAKMDSVSKDLETTGNQIIREGGSVPLKMAAAIARARASLSATHLAQLPVDQQRLLLDYFQSYVDYVAAKVQRRLELRDSFVQVKVLNKEVESYQQLIESNSNQTFLRNMQTIVIANNLQLSSSYAKVKETSDFLRFQVIPQLKLHYPKNYRELLASLSPDVIARESFDLSVTMKTIENLSDLLSSKLNQDVTQSLTNQRVTIALSFPRPGVNLDSTGFPKDVPIAGQELSKALWDLIFKGQNPDAYITLDPAQIFEAAGQNRFNRYGLGCSMTMPVINNMGLFLYTSSGAINEADMNQIFEVGMQMGPDLLLPTRNGPQKFALAEKEWGNIFARAHLIDRSRFHQIEKILAQDEQLGLSSGRGLSPFTSFSVSDGLSPNLGPSVDSLGYPQDIDVITIAFLVDVDKSSKAESNRWISSCNP